MSSNYAMSGQVGTDGVVEAVLPVSAQAAVVTPVGSAQLPDYDLWIVCAVTVEVWSQARPRQLRLMFYGCPQTAPGAPATIAPLPVGANVRFNVCA